MTLLNLLDDNKIYNSKWKDHLDGLINLLDTIQDEAVEKGLFTFDEGEEE